MNNDLYVRMVAQLGGNATPMACGAAYRTRQSAV